MSHVRPRMPINELPVPTHVGRTVAAGVAIFAGTIAMTWRYLDRRQQRRVALDERQPSGKIPPWQHKISDYNAPLRKLEQVVAEVTKTA